MRLIENLRHRASREDSLFRAQLLREDIARLEKLCRLARDNPDPGAFKSAGLRIGWTQGDARTHELRDPLERLLDLIHRHETTACGANLDDAIEDAWSQLHRCRMERLVGCLSTPVPKPVE